MALSWNSPPPLVIIGGTEHFLRTREVQKALLLTTRAGRSVFPVKGDSELSDVISSAATFGDKGVILAELESVGEKTVREYIDSPLDKLCVLLTHDSSLDASKFPVVDLAQKAHRVEYNQPTTKKAQRELAVRFVQVESETLLQNKSALAENLAEALVGAVGTDLGTLRYEVLKMAKRSKSLGENTISLSTLKSLVRASSEIDLSPLRDALRNRDPVKISSSLEKIRRVSPEDPVMLLLRSKGGVSDLVVTWLKASLLAKSGAKGAELASRLSVPEWALSKDILPAIQNWNIPSLRRLTGRLAEVDRGLLKGIPDPWALLESSILIECL